MTDQDSSGAPSRASDMLFRALGLEAPARHFGLRLMGPDARAALLGGTLQPGPSMTVGREAARGGLFDENVFGLLPRREDGSLRWKSHEHLEPRDRSQANRFGRFLLPIPLIHPFAHRVTRASEPLLGQLARGERVLTPEGELIEDDAGADRLRGGRAAIALAEAGRLTIDEPDILRDVPVLPAGLRPVVEDGGRYIVSDANCLYEALARQLARLARVVELGAPPIIVANEEHRLQGAVEALFFDGLVERCEEDQRWWERPREGEEPEVQGLASELWRHPTWAETVDELIEANPEQAFSQRWYAPPHLHRAAIEALALELVPLDGDGAVDEVRVAKARVDRAARAFAEVYEERLSPLFDLVLHDESVHGPHVDTYATEPRADGTRFVVTGGMSRERMVDSPRHGRCRHRRIELVLQLPAGIERELVVHAMRGLQALAHFPFRNQTFLAPLHDVEVGKPVAPGSDLDGFVLLDVPEEDPWWDLEYGLPGPPRFVFAVATTKAQRERFAAQGRSAAAVEHLLRETGGQSAFPLRAP